MAIIATLAMSMTAEAQLNGLLHKAKKGLEKAVEDTSSALKVGNAADVSLEAYGDTVSANYGNVTLVAKVTMKANKSQIRLGSVNNTAMMAVAPGGKVYKPELNLNGVYPKDVVEGVTVEIPLDDSDFIIKDVPLGTPMFQVVKLGVMVDSANKGTLTFKNVPIVWRPTQQ